MEIEWVRVIAAAGLLGILLAGCWVAAYFLSWCWAWVWAWIDDSKVLENNPLIRFSMLRMGWQKCPRSTFAYNKGDEISDGAIGFFLPLLTLSCAPPLFAASIAAYPVTLAMLLAYLLARLARFARRHKKLFDKHIKDPAAHKSS